MEPQQTRTTIPTIPTQRSGLPAGAWVAGGLMLVVIAGLAATLVLRNAPAAPDADSAAAGTVPVTTAKVVPRTAPKNNANNNSRSDAGGGDGGSDTRVAAAPKTCASCGVVESVREVQVKGEGSGLGAVAGSVLGGVVGHQMGGGDGKKALTVLGAVGGGVAGHEVEKRARGTTVYEVQVRMDDRSLRTLSLPQAPKTGERVTVDGQTLRPLNS